MSVHSLSPRPEVALAAVLYLMTRYQRVPCPAVARAIADHLQRLARHSEVDQCIRSLCVALREEWERVAGSAQSLHAGAALH